MKDGGRSIGQKLGPRVITLHVQGNNAHTLVGATQSRHKPLYKLTATGVRGVRQDYSGNVLQQSG